VSYAHVFMIVPLTRIRSSGGGRQQRRRIDMSGDDLPMQLRRVHHCNLTTTRFMETTTQRQPTTVLKTKTVWFLVLLCGAVVESSLSHRATIAKQTRVIQSYVKTARKFDASATQASMGPTEKHLRSCTTGGVLSFVVGAFGGAFPLLTGIAYFPFTHQNCIRAGQGPCSAYSPKKIKGRKYTKDSAFN
jgi:hypothetical protein